MKLYSTDVFYSGMGNATEHAAVVVTDSHIVATGSLAELQNMYPRAVFVQHVPVIAPPPVNPHTHLDMSTLPFRAAPYTDWISWVVSQREQRNLNAAQHGVKLHQDAETFVLGDIVTRPEVMEYLLTREDMSGVAYWEVLNPNPSTAADTFRTVVGQIQHWQKIATKGMRVGLSPHTGHTVSGKLLRMLAEFARVEGIPMQIHLAEAPEEIAFYQSGSGRLAEVMARAFQVSAADILGRAPDAGYSPVLHLAELGVLNAKPTLIHMVHCTAQDAQIVAQAGCTVVSCPRSNHHLQCGTFDWQLFAQNGVEVALATDSLASGESLNIADELHFAQQVHPHIPLKALVRAVVKGGYKALGSKVPFIRRGEPIAHLHLWG